jgi:hypothetical protein
MQSLYYPKELGETNMPPERIGGIAQKEET